MSITNADALREAWRESAGDTPAARMSRRSLAALATSRPDLRPVYAELTAPQQDLLDLHIDGATIADHSAPARQVGQFMQKVAAAVKAVAKSDSGRRRLPDNLLVSALAPGSIRMTFTSKPASEIAGHEAVQGADIATLETVALRRVVAILLQADTSTSALDSTVHDLNSGAQSALRGLGRAVFDSNWQVEGSLTHRQSGQKVPLRFGVQGAARLLDATELISAEEVLVTWGGFVDGWTWSNGTMRFESTDHGSFDASVGNADLQDLVAHFLAEQRPVTCDFRMLVSHRKSDQSTTRRSFTLLGIKEQPPEPSLLD